MEFNSIDRWLFREQNYNDWHIKDANFIPLPFLRERKFNEKIKEIKKYNLDNSCLVKVFANKNKTLIKEFNDKTLLNENEASSFYTLENEGDLLSLNEYENISVTRSLSARSFYKDNFMLKVSFPKLEDSFISNRALFGAQIERAIRISSYLESRTFSGIEILPEIFGCYLNDKQFDAGYILRSLPKDLLNNKTSLVSIVSFFSNKSKSNDSMLDDFVKKYGIAKSLTFLQELAEKVIDCFLDVYWKTGVILELHQQNTLIELDSNDYPTGKLFYRDLDGARVDPDLVSYDDFKLNGEVLSQKEIENYFEIGKVKRIKKNILPERVESSTWNGVTLFAFKMYLEDSTLYIMQRGIDKCKSINTLNFSILDYAIKYLNYRLKKKENGC